LRALPERDTTNEAAIAAAGASAGVDIAEGGGSYVFNEAALMMMRNRAAIDT
jgi:hypothetical protein